MACALSQSASGLNSAVLSVESGELIDICLLLSLPPLFHCNAMLVDLRDGHLGHLAAIANTPNQTTGAERDRSPTNSMPNPVIIARGQLFLRAEILEHKGDPEAVTGELAISHAEQL